uniref:Yip1 domain-containing protein n=2 Tax=Bacilli TaxID=91061 RepID=C5D899_GEOSW
MIDMKNNNNLNVPQGIGLKSISHLPVAILILFNYLTYKLLSNKFHIDELVGSTMFGEIVSVINIVTGIATILVIWLLFSFILYIGVNSLLGKPVLFRDMLKVVSLSFIPMVIASVIINIITIFDAPVIDLRNITDVTKFQQEIDSSFYKQITDSVRIIGYVSSTILCWFLIKHFVKVTTWASVIVVYTPILMFVILFISARLIFS